MLHNFFRLNGEANTKIESEEQLVALLQQPRIENSSRETPKLVDLVSRRFRLGLHVRSIEADETLQSVPTNDEITKNWYLRSRLIERALLGLRPRESAAREIADCKRRLQQIVKEPSQYGWRMKTEWSSLVKQLHIISADSDVCFSRS